jgi:Family of unknown function (DUF6174)
MQDERRIPHHTEVEALMTRRIGTIASLLCVIALPGCGGGGENVTPESLENARRLWASAGIKDYDLEWTSAGLMDGHYRVFVRDGRVRRIRSVLGDGREIDARPAMPEMFGVDGLFKVIEEERLQLNDERPFGQPKGSKVVLKFTPDPRLGYPKSYRRDVMGSPKGLLIDVIRLDASSSREIPPPAS